MSDCRLRLHRWVVGAMMEDDIRNALVAECDRLRAQLARVEAFRLQLLKTAQTKRAESVKHGATLFSAVGASLAYQDAADALLAVLSEDT